MYSKCNVIKKSGIRSSLCASSIRKMEKCCKQLVVRLLTNQITGKHLVTVSSEKITGNISASSILVNDACNKQHHSNQRSSLRE